MPGAHWERTEGEYPNLDLRVACLRWTPQRRAKSTLGACQGRTGSAQGEGVLIWICAWRIPLDPSEACQEPCFRHAIVSIPIHKISVRSAMCVETQSVRFQYT